MRAAVRFHTINPMTEREFATNVIRQLHAANFTALWAGGCVRDELLGLEPDDYDVATDARPEQVQKLFRKTVAVGASFGVVEVLGPKPLKVQVATFRSEGAYSDGRRPDAVTFSSAREDAVRRDFTINGLFFDPLAGRLIDFVGGEKDLKDRVLRAIGDPAERFSEDKLRLLRAVRIATRFDLTIEAATLTAIRAMSGQITVISAERIAEELRKLLVHPARARGVRLLAETGLLPAVFPELGNIPADRFSHTLSMLERFGEPVSFPLAFATLVRDVGKRQAGAIAVRLRLSNSEKNRIEWLVENRQALGDAAKLPWHVLKPFLAHFVIGDLLTLHRADALAAGRDDAHVQFCEQKLREWPAEVLDPPPLITGDDLAALGLSPGPRFKELLDAVTKAQLDETVQTRDEALEFVHRLVAIGN